MVSVAALILASLPSAETQAGICPNYYGPCGSNSTGQSECCGNYDGTGDNTISSGLTGWSAQGIGITGRP